MPFVTSGSEALQHLSLQRLKSQRDARTAIGYVPSTIIPIRYEPRQGSPIRDIIISDAFNIQRSMNQGHENHVSHDDFEYVQSCLSNITYTRNRNHTMIPSR